MGRNWIIMVLVDVWWTSYYHEHGGRLDEEVLLRCVTCPGNDDVSNAHPVAELLFGDSNSFSRGRDVGKMRL